MTEFTFHQGVFSPIIVGIAQIINSPDIIFACIRRTQKRLPRKFKSLKCVNCDIMIINIVYRNVSIQLQ